MCPDSRLRLWRYINHLLTYLHHFIEYRAAVTHLNYHQFTIVVVVVIMGRFKVAQIKVISIFGLKHTNHANCVDYIQKLTGMKINARTLWRCHKIEMHGLNMWSLS